MDSNALSLDSRFETDESVLYRRLSDEAVLVNLRTGRYFGLDPIGVRIWELLGSGRRLQEVIAAVVEEFEVDEKTCQRDLMQLVAELESKELVHFLGA